jgi:hypothetical protein
VAPSGAGTVSWAAAVAAKNIPDAAKRIVAFIHFIVRSLVEESPSAPRPRGQNWYEKLAYPL